MNNRPGNAQRDVLFGESLALEGVVTEARFLFAKARDDLERGDKLGAHRALETIGLMRELESLCRIHAWNLLRQHGGIPPTSVKNVILGVLVEVGMEKGDDLLATYDDRTARYYNFSGAGVVWMRPNSSLDTFIDAVLDAAGSIVPRIGPWEKARRPPPARDNIRLNVLTPFGLHFGEGPLDALDRDPLARPLVQAATNLMAKLTSLPAAKRAADSRNIPVER